MRVIRNIVLSVVVLIVAVAIGAFGWIYFFPPDLLRVGTAYAAKMVCSSHLISGRDPAQVFAEDVQAPGHPLLKDIEVVQTDRDQFSASLYGWIATSVAVHRDGLGCAVAPDGDVEAVRAVRIENPLPPLEESEFEWPLGDEVSLEKHAGVQALITDTTLAGPGMRAIVVVKNGRIIAETYAPGYTKDTPLMGWSMTKTVTAALVALRVGEGRLAWDQDHLFPDWTDDRAKIKLSDLMAMQSGLDLEETYGDVNDVTRMLFLEPDQAAFVAAKGLEAEPGTKFEYTTGSAVLLSRLWMNTFGNLQEALTYPRRALFDRIGMRSAVMETDAVGTFSGGSLMYATARDWARFGLLLVNGGDWNGIQLLPEEFARMVSTGTALSGGRYTSGLTWKVADQDGERPARLEGLPEDMFWAQGHDGQTLAMIPSEGLVVVRLGLTPANLKYRPMALIARVIEAAREMPEEETTAE